MGPILPGSRFHVYLDLFDNCVEYFFLRYKKSKGALKITEYACIPGILFYLVFSDFRLSFDQGLEELEPSRWLSLLLDHEVSIDRIKTETVAHCYESTDQKQLWVAKAKKGAVEARNMFIIILIILRRGRVMKEKLKGYTIWRWSDIRTASTGTWKS